MKRFNYLTRLHNNEIKKISFILLYFLISFSIFSAEYLAQQMPPSFNDSKSEPVKYIGEADTDPHYHHGGLRQAVGVHRYQAFRANREYPPEIGSRTGWTYNHQPYLCYWNGQYFLQYLSDQYTEHLPPGRTLLMVSHDGFTWSNPDIVFPEYSLPEIIYDDPESGKSFIVPEGTKAVMHQRSGFYISSNDKLLTLGFYSYCPTARIGPNKGHGLGRVVREIYKDGRYGPIYFIRYNRHAGWNENNTKYPFYTESNDKEFVAACEELLKDKLATLQWWEEDQADDGFYNINPGDHQPKAFNYFRRLDGVLVGLWKHQLSALSSDGGESWSDFALSKTLKTCGAKIWGQRTPDNRYALVYNHSATRRNRFPLVVMTSDNGYEFNNMLSLHGEVPPKRYYGWAKQAGPQYVRGIMPGNGNPPGNYMWNTYSVNKEDIWVSRTLVPITGIVDQHVNQNFDDVNSVDELELWNLYVPKWAPVNIISPVNSTNKVLELIDEEPYDYAKVERSFPPGTKVEIKFDFIIKQTGKDNLEFEVHNDKNERALRIIFNPELEGMNFDLGKVEPWSYPIKENRWYKIKLELNCESSDYNVWLNGELIREDIELNIETDKLERMIFRTGSWRMDVRQYVLDGSPSGPGLDSEDLAGAGEKVDKSIFWIDNIETNAF